MLRVLSTEGLGGKVLPQTQHLPPEKFLNKKLLEVHKGVIMHAHTTLSIVYLSTVSILYRWYISWGKIFTNFAF